MQTAPESAPPLQQLRKPRGPPRSTAEPSRWHLRGKPAFPLLFPLQDEEWDQRFPSLAWVTMLLGQTHRSPPTTVPTPESPMESNLRLWGARLVLIGPMMTCTKGQVTNRFLWRAYVLSYWQGIIFLNFLECLCNCQSIKKGSSSRTIKCVCIETCKEIRNQTHRTMCFPPGRDHRWTLSSRAPGGNDERFALTDVCTTGEAQVGTDRSEKPKQQK